MSCSVCEKVAVLRCSVCNLVKYCGSTCQKQDWKMHKLMCMPSAESCPACNCIWADCTCTEKPSCWICLESNGTLQRGCACRGTSGYLHIDCIVKASLYFQNRDMCPTCDQQFCGKIRTAIAKEENNDRQLAAAHMSNGDFDEALDLYIELIRSNPEDARVLLK